MIRYQVKIEGDTSSQSYTLDELLEVGLLDDYDDKILVRAVGEEKWQVALNYPFYISEQSSNINGFYVNKDGTVTRYKSSSASSQGYKIDKFGQIRRTASNRSARLDLSTCSLSFLSGGGSSIITITANDTWSISVGSASWVSLSKNENSLKVIVGANNSSSSRTDYFKLKSGNIEKRVDIYQAERTTSTTFSDDGIGCGWVIFIISIIITVISLIAMNL